jgi:import inner membrane translocase subunit TIM44
VSFLASIFSQSETSEALTEICRVDPTFDVAQFLRIVQYDVIPNIFEVNKRRFQMII